MEIEIKDRFGNILISGKYESVRKCLEKNRGASLRDADLHRAYLSGADLHRAYLSEATLTYADLSGASLRGADLSGADLSYASLRGADLRGADLSGASLSDAKMKEPLFLPDLYNLKLLPPDTVLRFWKYLTNAKSPYKGHKYDIGKEYEFSDANEDEQETCGAGGNIATLVWCLKDNISADEFMEVEFKAGDICAIPYSTDGKFRVRRFKTLRIINRTEAIKLLKDAMGVEDMQNTEQEGE